MLYSLGDIYSLLRHFRKGFDDLLKTLIPTEKERLLTAWQLLPASLTSSEELEAFANQLLKLLSSFPMLQQELLAGNSPLQLGESHYTRAIIDTDILLHPDRKPRPILHNSVVRPTAEEVEKEVEKITQKLIAAVLPARSR